MDKCKVVGCENLVIGGIKNKYRAVGMEDQIGYCQIHLIEGIIEEE